MSSRRNVEQEHWAGIDDNVALWMGNERTVICLDDFARHPDVDTDHCANLVHALRSSRPLRDVLNNAVNSGAVCQINPSFDNTGASYEAYSRSLELSLDSLGERFNRHETTFLVGHELGHAADRDMVIGSENLFFGHARVGASMNPPDFTQAVGLAIDNTRVLEGRAQVRGWNVLVETLREESRSTNAAAPLDLKRIYRSCPDRMHDFIDIQGRRSLGSDTYRLKEGIHLNPDLTMPMTDRNVNRMIQYYADAPVVAQQGFGQAGTADYRHHSATESLNNIVRAFDYGRRNDREQMDIRIDFASLRLEPSRIEACGVDLAGGSRALQVSDRTRGSESCYFFLHSLRAASSVWTSPSNSSRPSSDSSSRGSSVASASDVSDTSSMASSRSSSPDNVMLAVRRLSSTPSKTRRK